MSLSLILFLVALVLSIIELVRGGGRSLGQWALVLVCVGLTFGFWRGL